MITLICDCCRFTEDFDDTDDAFNEGWDCPPHFTGYVSCNLCPGSYIVMGQSFKHEPIHEKWAKEGRPNRNFDVMQDVVEEERPNAETFKNVQDMLRELMGD